MAPNSRTERIKCSHRGCRKTFLRIRRAGRPQLYCSIACRTKAATERRRTKTREGQSGLNVEVLNELSALTTLIRQLGSGQLPKEPAPTPPEPVTDLAEKVVEVCADLRQMTQYLAAHPGDTRVLKITNDLIEQLRKQAAAIHDEERGQRHQG